MMIKTFNNNNIIKLYRTSAKSHLILNDIQHQVILGSMLGDLSAERPSIKHNTRLQFKQSQINKQYLLHMYTLFEQFTGSKPIKLISFDKRICKTSLQYSFKFNTLSLPCFNIYRKMFYNENNVKKVPLNINELLTARSLAYWYMDDGYYYKPTKGFYLSTDSYQIDDILILQHALSNKFNLSASYHKTTNGYRIYIPGKVNNLFIKLIEPYVINHFKYKLGI